MALIDKLTAIGDGFRTSRGTTDKYTLDQMAVLAAEPAGGGSAAVIESLEITRNGTYTATDCDGYSPITVNVSQDGALPESAFIISGNCTYKFNGTGWNWFLELCENKLSTDNITNADSMFRNNSGIEDISFDLNLAQGSNVGCGYMFYGASNLKSVPYIRGKISDCGSMFANCSNLREIPSDWGSTIDWSYMHTNSYAAISGMFGSCYSLKEVPQSLLSELWTTGTSGNYVPYSGMFSSCYALSEIVGLPVHNAKLTSNRCSNFLTYCDRVKKLTFETNSDGTAKTATWKSQVIDTSLCGYASAITHLTEYNSGITLDKRVMDDATYQALKDDPDWFTIDINYCRYNHDSAVETINSLPDTSATGTNTIKFKSAAGAKTDGGAINTLTEEEIAVATAKGWTVTLV